MEGRSSFCHAISALLIFHHLTNCTGYSLPATAPTNPNTDYIKNSCNTTLYPEICYKYLVRYASRIHTSPRLLAQTALAVSLSSTRSASGNLKNVSETLDLNSRETGAMKDCLELLSDSVYELDISMKQMGHTGSGWDFMLAMSNVETWVSSALTDDDTCMDGFSAISMNGKAKNVVRRIVLKVAHLASIALAFINNYASI